MKNTVLFIEPRKYHNLPKILNHYFDILGDTHWEYIFYCGKDNKTHWEKTNLNKIYQIRELDVDNFQKPSMYSDFMKNKQLWESLNGDFVLTGQLDTWIFSDNGYTIYDFIELNKSYIGGNMSYYWKEVTNRENIAFNYKNFNGGLSLRKRKDMIKIIDSFPPEPTSDNHTLTRTFFTDAEDVYFTLGCYKLGLPIGDDEYCSHFAIHYVFKDKFFGIHCPSKDITTKINNLYPDLNFINPHLQLYTLVKTNNSRAVYLICNNTKFLIPSMAVFNGMGFKWKHLIIISEDRMNEFENGNIIQ
jgi:hypothetical protein